MAHEIEIINGKACTFAVGKTPWHGLGTILNTPPTVAEGIAAAGLDWTVGLKPLFTADNKAVDHRATFRQTDGKIFGVVGPGYTPLQNVDAFQWFQPLLDSGEASLHAAGSLQEGRKVWVLAKINRPALEIADGDTVERFILLSNSHDGTRAVRLGFTPIRVVCANTLRMAHDERSNSQLVKLLHTKNITLALDDLRAVMNTANNAFEATATQYRRLAQHKISRSDLRKYVKIVLGVEKEEDKDLPTQTLNKIDAIIRAAEVGKGNDMPAIKGTLWAAYNGITEYLGYEFGRTQDARIDSLWWGQNSHLNQKALETAIAMAS